MWNSVRPSRQEPEHGEILGCQGQSRGGRGLAPRVWPRDTCGRGHTSERLSPEFPLELMRSRVPRVPATRISYSSAPGGVGGAWKEEGLSLPHKCSEPLEKGTLRLKVSREPICSRGPQRDGWWRFESRELTFLCSLVGPGLCLWPPPGWGVTYACAEFPSPSPGLSCRLLST